MNRTEPIWYPTDYGFRWLPKEATAEITVERIANFRGTAVLGIRTDHDEVQVTISPGGRSIRVWRGSEELT